MISVIPFAVPINSSGADCMTGKNHHLVPVGPRTAVRRFLRLASVPAAGLLFYGCATIIHGTKQGVGISSYPSGATVSINGFESGRTPLITSLARKNSHIVKVELSGYRPFEAIITRSMSGWVWGNVVFGGPIGLAVDIFSGGLYKLTPEQMSATLSKEGVAAKFRKNTLSLVVTMRPDSSWEKVGTLTREEDH